jgi:hypothetical protein
MRAKSESISDDPDGQIYPSARQKIPQIVFQVLGRRTGERKEGQGYVDGG